MDICSAPIIPCLFNNTSYFCNPNGNGEMPEWSPEGPKDSFGGFLRKIGAVSYIIFQPGL